METYYLSELFSEDQKQKDKCMKKVKDLSKEQKLSIQQFKEAYIQCIKKIEKTNN